MRRFAALFIGAVTCLGAAHVALADGAFFPPQAYPKMPEIPAQRAIIVHRDGVETLIVESAVKSESADVAWILPLPAEPTEITPVDPGLLTTAWFCTRPRVVHAEHSSLPLIAGISLFVLILGLCLAPITKGRWTVLDIKNTRAGLPSIVLVGLLVVMMLIIMPAMVIVFVAIALYVVLGLSVLHAISTMPYTERRWPRVGRFLLTVVGLPLIGICTMFPMALTLGSARAGASVGSDEGVEVLQVHRAGSYDVEVLRADTAKDLTNWLAAREFQRPDDDAGRIIDDYISRGWCFAVAALRVVEGEPSKAHPLRVTFPAAEPIYPMRLTALAESSVAVELYVVADRRAGHPVMETVFVDSYREGLAPPDGTVVFRGNVSSGVGLPDLCDLMWDGCAMTRLTGTFTPEQMAVDVRPRLEHGRQKRQTFHSERGAGILALVIGLVGLHVAGLAVLLRYVIWTRPRLRTTIALGVVLAGMSVVAAIIGYTLIPRISTTTAIGGRWHGMTLRSATEEAVSHPREDAGIRADMSDREIEERLFRGLDERGIERNNPFLSGSIRREKSPGNFWIERSDGKVTLIVYDSDGTPRRVEVPEREQQLPAG